MGAERGTVTTPNYKPSVFILFAHVRLPVLLYRTGLYWQEDKYSLPTLMLAISGGRMQSESVLSLAVFGVRCAMSDELYLPHIVYHQTMNHRSSLI